jgi:PPOX class probable F420-dependent enzyme
VIERLAHGADRLFDRLRHRAAFDITEAAVSASDFASLGDHKHLVLVTFRRSGEPVPTPVWFAVDGDVVYVKTAASSGKVKRLRHDERALVAVSTQRGAPRGPVVAAVGRVLPPAEWARAEAALRARYGAGRAAAERTLGRLGDDAYLELAVRRQAS